MLIPYFLGVPAGHFSPSLSLALHLKLIDSRNASLVWSGTYDRPLTDSRWYSVFSEVETVGDAFSDMLNEAIDAAIADLREEMPDIVAVLRAPAPNWAAQAPSPAVASRSAEAKAVTFVSPPADQHTSHRIAIWQLTPLDGVPAQGMAGLTETLRACLLDTKCFKVIARGEMEKVLKEQEITLSSTCDTTDCAVEYGQLLSVEKILVGSVAKIVTMYQVVIKLIDVQKGEIEKTGQAQKSGGEEVLFALVKKAAADLVD